MKNIAKNFILSVISLTAVFGTSAFAADLSGWAEAEYQSASEAGLVSHAIVSHNLTEDITREEFCELAMNLYKKLAPEALNEYKKETEKSTAMGSPFVDTNSDVAIWAYNFGVASGTPSGEFAPNRDVTREEMAKMLVSVMCATELDGFQIESTKSDSEILNFSDANQISSWAKNSIKLALEYQLINGINDNELNPLGSVTREQAIATINRTYNNFKSEFLINDYSVALPTITLPNDGDEIEDGDFTISWTSIPNASAYHVIIKDVNANSVVLDDIYNSTSYMITKGTLPGTKEYTLIVGAVLNDGSEVYSMPVDFKYKAKSGSAYAANSAKAQQVIDTAAKYLGVPYLWGGTTPSGFDCSGFVQYVLRENGISITRTTYTQWDNDGVYVSRSELQPGDLVYFGSSSAPHHVGMYVGNGMYIHAPRTGDVVKYSSLDSRSDFCGGKRVIR